MQTPERWPARPWSLPRACFALRSRCKFPPQRGASQPELSLSYSSSAGIREAGLGWGLDMPTIERRNLSGPPRYVIPESSMFNYDGNPEVYFDPQFPDDFAYSGAPLVPICIIAAANTCADVSEPMPTWVVPGTIYFRLENDTLGARFFWWPDRFTWRVQLPGGQILEFGHPLVTPIVDAWDDGIDFDTHFAGSTFTNPPVPIVRDDVFRWNLVRRYDPPSSGFPRNVVVYRWTKRGPLTGRGYLTDVYYTPAELERDERMPVEMFAHHLRLEWEANGSRGITQTPVWRATPELVLTRIDVATNERGIGDPRQMVRRYHLGYSGVMNRLSHLTSFQMEGRCDVAVREVNESLPATSCTKLPATTLRYSKEIEQLDLPSLLLGRRIAETAYNAGIESHPIGCELRRPT